MLGLAIRIMVVLYFVCYFGVCVDCCLRLNLVLLIATVNGVFNSNVKKLRLCR